MPDVPRRSNGSPSCRPSSTRSFKRPKPTPGRARSKINDAKDDSVKDNWWERNAGWLKGLATVLGAIAAVARIILLTVATAGTIWLVVAVVAGIAALLINRLGLAIKADGSWVDVAFDAIGLLTLGAGSVIGRSIQAAWKGMSTAVAAARSTKAFDAAVDGAFFYRFAGRGVDLHVKVFAWRVPVRLPFVTKMAEGYRAGVIDDALGAAQEAWYATTIAPPAWRWPASGGVVSTRRGLRPG